MVEGAAAAGTKTEAFSWLVTASSTGGAIGTALAGALVQSVGAPAAFGVVAAAGLPTTLVRAALGRPVATRC